MNNVKSLLNRFFVSRHAEAVVIVSAEIQAGKKSGGGKPFNISAPLIHPETEGGYVPLALASCI